MTPDRYDKLRTIFFQVCDLDPQSRTTALEQYCGDDAALRHDIQELLAFDVRRNDVALTNDVHATLNEQTDTDDVAQAALYLCSDMGAFVTGQTLMVDGGASLLALPTPQMFADVARRWQEAREAT